MKIGNIDIGELKPVPELETGDEKEVFAFYGLTSFNAQCAEKALVNFAMGYRLLDKAVLDQEEWIDIYDDLNSKTFGSLLRKVKQRVDFPEEVITHLDAALKKRNWLAHDFFYDYAMHMLDAGGRIEMIQELQSLMELFQIADRAVEKLSQKIWAHFGIDEEWMQNEMETQLREYQLARSTR